MPAWEDYKKSAKARGALGFELYAVQTTPIGTPEEMQATLPDHFAYQAKLEAEGKLFLAGPMSDLTGEMMEGIGLIIYRASSMEEAVALADADPMHREKVRSYTLRKWMINEGSPRIETGLSAQKVRLT